MSTCRHRLWPHELGLSLLGHHLGLHCGQPRSCRHRLWPHELLGHNLLGHHLGLHCGQPRLGNHHELLPTPFVAT